MGPIYVRRDEKEDAGDGSDDNDDEDRDSISDYTHPGKETFTSVTNPDNNINPVNILWYSVVKRGNKWVNMLAYKRYVYI